MTVETISKYYKWSSIATLILSVVGPMILVEGSVGEKLWIGLLMNGQFHLAYQTLSRLFFEVYNQVQDGTTQKRYARIIIIGMSGFMMIAPIFPLIGLVKTVITDHKYEQMMVIMTFLAIFLGSYSLNLKLRKGN
jgi:hypothetical protein